MERQVLLLIMVTKCKQANLGLHTQHQESTSIAGLTTQTISKQFADWANDNKHKYINKKSEAFEPRFFVAYWFERCLDVR